MPFNARSLTFRISALFAATVILLVIVFNTYPLRTTQSFMAEGIKSDLLQTANIISSGISGGKILEEQKIKSIMSILSLEDTERVIVTDNTGFAIYDNSEYENIKGKYVFMEELVKALQGDETFHSIFRDGTFESVVSVPIVIDNEIAGAVYIYENSEELGQLLISMQAYMRNASLILLAATGIGFTFFALGISKRLTLLHEGVTKLREGDYSSRINIHGKDEISRVADEFNSLTERLEVTEERRRLFVSNASHELKTPLASIKLLTDSILQTDNMSREDINDFLGDISGEISRLTRITDRLLRLTKLDINLHKEYECVDVSYIVERAAHMLHPMEEHYGISIRCDVSENCFVYAEEDGIYQIVFNLMENAAKYNRKGGYVHAMTYVRDGMVWCIVDDDGIGLPEDELEKIFERFYRVDKARSRETGGTGLGLSIVLNTVEQYGGKVWAENRKAGGSRFTFTLPHYIPHEETEAEK